MPDRNARIWTGSDWELISAPVSTPNAIATYQATAPSSPTTGQIWIDSDDNVVYTWNGSSWINIQALPSQDNESGKYLTTSGTVASWSNPFFSPTFTGTVVLPSTTSIGDVSSTEISYLDGVTSSIQNQLNSKANSASPTFTGTITVSGILDVSEIRESVVDVTLSSNVATLDWTAGNVYYIATAPTANMTFNVTNLPTDNSKIMTVGVIVTQGATGYIPNTFQIAGSSQTIKWIGGFAPVATSGAGKIDIFTFTIQRTSGGSWIVYGTSSLGF